jgi:hypothetical protein
MQESGGFCCAVVETLAYLEHHASVRIRALTVYNSLHCNPKDVRRR